MRKRDNFQPNRRLRDNLVQIEYKPRPKKRQNWPLFLLVIIVIIAAILAIVTTYYHSVRDHYQEFIYSSTINSRPTINEEVSYLLNVVVSNQEEDGVEVESATWAQLYQLDPIDRRITKYVLPLNADYVDGGAVHILQPYAEVGVNGIIQQLEDLLAIQIHSGAVTRLDYIRDYTNMLAPITLETTNSDYDAILRENNSSLDIPIRELSGLQVQQIFQFYQGETDIKSLEAREDLLMEVYSELWSWDTLLDLNDVIESSERFVDSSLIFSELSGFLIPPYDLEKVSLDDLSSVNYNHISQRVSLNLQEFKQEISTNN